MANHVIEQPDVGTLAAIRQTAMDYMQGWYEADVERMAGCLHPDLVKCSVRSDPQTGGPRLSHLSRQQMIAKTREGGGAEIPSGQRTYQVTILDISGEIASVKAVSYEYVDYLQVARWDGKWLIVNVLWAENQAE